MPENVQQNVLLELEKDQGIPEVKEDEIKEQVQDIVSESADTKTEEKEDVAKNDTQVEDTKQERNSPSPSTLVHWMQNSNAWFMIIIIR